MTSKTTPLGAVVRGLLAGAAGTAIMDAVWYARYRKDGGTSGFLAWETAAGLDSFEDAPAPAQVGKRVVEGLRLRELKPDRARLVTNLVHWGYGLAWSAAYGIVAASTSRPRTTYGLWKDASAHLAYGLGTAASFKLLAGRS